MGKWAAGLLPPPLLTPAEWADRHRVLSSRASSEPGPWRTDRTPYLREPLECLGTHHEAHTVVLQFGAQLGKSEAGNCWIGYMIHSEPGPALLVQPTAEMAGRYSRQRLAPLIAESPVLRDLVAAPRGRDESNTLSVKEFPGGVLLLTGANSAAGLRSMPIRYVFADEVDAWPSSIPGEGDPLALALRRTSTFPNRKVLITSTPTIKGQSRVERLYQESDRREYFVPCPHCGEFQVLRWSNVRWPKGEPAGAYYVCEHCGAEIEEHFKASMLPAGEWRASAEFTGTAGFHLPTVYSPLGWTSWADLAREHQSAYATMKNGDTSVMQVFMNTRLAQTWEPTATRGVEAHELVHLCRDYQVGTIPIAGPVVIVAGVDVQDDRIEASVFAFSDDNRAYLITHEVISGFPGDSSTWNQLAELLSRRWPLIGNESGVSVHHACIDSGGHFTDVVYRFCGQESKRRTAVKGATWQIAGAVGPQKMVDGAKRGNWIRLVNTNFLKQRWFERLQQAPGTSGSIAFPSDIEEQVPGYFAQLCSERMVEESSGGVTRYRWVRRGSVRNEALDCAVYALACAAGSAAAD